MLAKFDPRDSRSSNGCRWRGAPGHCHCATHSLPIPCSFSSITTEVATLKLVFLVTGETLAQYYLTQTQVKGVSAVVAQQSMILDPRLFTFSSCLLRTPPSHSSRVTLRRHLSYSHRNCTHRTTDCVLATRRQVRSTVGDHMWIPAVLCFRFRILFFKRQKYWHIIIIMPIHQIEVGIKHRYISNRTWFSVSH